MTNLEKRTLLMRDMNRSRLQVGGSAFTKRALLNLVEGDEDFLRVCLREWEGKGLLQIDWQSFDQGNGTPVLMKDYIEMLDPWKK
ncbi:MAG: hypothetical protein JWM33_1428 [Caulobacteraceae bacterium]|nr:hypothetical protein [Caulobacteraceae bacterium]